MDEENLLFSNNALWHLAELIEQRYKGDISNLLFVDHKSISQFLYRAGFSTKKTVFQHGDVHQTLIQIQNLNNAGEQNNIIRIIEQLCDHEEYIGEPKSHRQTVLKKVNEILSHYNYKVRPDGEVSPISTIEAILDRSVEIDKRKRAAKARRTAREANAAKAKNLKHELFDARNFHVEIQKHARIHFVEGRHFAAVFECCKAFDRYVSKKSNKNEYGTKLMQSALAPNNNSAGLRLNELRTETEKNEQNGLLHLSTGLMFAARNPGGHEPALDYPLNEQDALDLLSLVSFLYRQIDKTKYVQQ